MTSRRFPFRGSGDAELAGRLDLPAGPAAGTAVLAHCFTRGDDSVAAARLSRALTARGLAVLRFDVTAVHGFSDDGASEVPPGVEDLVLAAEHVATTVAPTTLLVGHSLGGAAVLAAAARLPEVAAVVTIGTPADPAHASALRRPLLVLHSPTDELVGIDNARTLFEAARHPKSFVALDGADHMLTRPDDADFVADVVTAWVGRYLPPPSAEPGPDEDAVVVVGTADDGLRHTLLAGRHRWVLDEPVPVGTDLGPTPYDALLAALGGCTAMTVRMYAQRKGWPLQDVTVALRHDRIHADDCADCDTTEGRVDRVRREITLDGQLDAGQRARLLEVADRCPVHRTLGSEITIETREGEPASGR